MFVYFPGIEQMRVNARNAWAIDIAEVKFAAEIVVHVLMPKAHTVFAMHSHPVVTGGNKSDHQIKRDDNTHADVQYVIPRHELFFAGRDIGSGLLQW